MTLARPPLALPGQRIGLYGGSFNPPHAGHEAVSREALKRLDLDRVWWLVSPQNPLKDARETEALATRLAKAEAWTGHPRITATGIETELGTQYTVDTLKALRRRCPDVRFVWLMGADNLATVHLWQEWQTLFELVPVAVVDRPGFGLRALHGPAARRYASGRIDESDAAALPLMAPPAWVFLHIPLCSESSTALRNG